MPVVGLRVVRGRKCRHSGVSLSVSLTLYRALSRCPSSPSFPPFRSLAAAERSGRVPDLGVFEHLQRFVRAVLLRWAIEVSSVGLRGMNGRGWRSWVMAEGALSVVAVAFAVFYSCQWTALAS